MRALVGCPWKHQSPEKGGLEEGWDGDFSTGTASQGPWHPVTLHKAAWAAMGLVPSAHLFVVRVGARLTRPPPPPQQPRDGRV